MTDFTSKSSQSDKITDLYKYLNVLPSDKTTRTNLEEIIDFQYIGEKISSKYFPNIEDHIVNLSSFGSRVTGYPGYRQATKYIHDFFKTQNLSDVQNLSYPLLIPYDRETKLSINGENYTAHALVPNSVQTSKIPSSGLLGTLIYGGSGSYNDLNNKKIEDSIVVLEFNTQDNWINVASLGAKAVIFLPPTDTDRYEAEDKSLDIPLLFPRIYIHNKTTANTLKQFSYEMNQSITLFSDIEWVSIEAKNVMGILPGLDNDIIIISAHYDSSSVVPSISPGADEACGIATLLELIRVFRDENITPQKTIMFLALSGHNQAAAGAREFVYQNYDFLNIKGGIKFFLSLDLSATDDKIGINPYGYLYKLNLKHTLGNNLYGRLKSFGNALLSYVPLIREETGYSLDIESYIKLESFEHIAPITFIGDHEPFITSNVLGLTLYTTSTPRLHFNTPFDWPIYLQFDKLKSQVVYSIIAITLLVNEETLGNYLDLAHKDFSLSYASFVGFGSIKGYSKEYNETIAWVSNVPNAIIRVTSRDSVSGTQGIYSYYTKTDTDGYYQVRGVSSSQPDNPLEFVVEAYMFDSKGKLIKANNLGSYGEFFKHSDKLTHKETVINPTIFNCGTIGFFGVADLFDDDDQSIDQSQYFLADSLTYQILSPEARNQLLSYGFKGAKTVSLVFISPNMPSILIGELPNGMLVVYATNSSASTLRGHGYQVKLGEFKILGLSTFITSKDLNSLSQYYIDLYKSFSIYDDQVDKNFLNASTLFSEAIQFKNNFNYVNAIITMNEAYKWSFTTHRQARNVISGAISTAMLFSFFLIPFSLIMSQLLFTVSFSRKWLFTSSSIYVVTFSLFYFIHPAFQVAPHLFITLIGIISVVSVLPSIFLFFQVSYGFLKGQQKKILGSHFPRTSRMSAILISLRTGISRMKNHKVRTTINLSGIGLLTFSLTLYTSASALFSNNFIGLIFPIVIAIFLMINNSITAVYESKREISIFTSLGLTPSHIVSLFLIESVVSVTIGSTLGYLGGIAFIRFISAVGLIPVTLPINYSSGAVLAALTITSVGILLSIIYPLKISGQMSVPSLKRNWELTTFPEESPEDGRMKWHIELPFITSSEKEAQGVIEFLREYFLIYESESVGGPFFVHNIAIKNIEGQKKLLTTTLNLAPFDMGIKQIMNFYINFDKKKQQWVFEIKLIRLEGVLMAWEALVRIFIKNIRKQLLIWKSLPNNEKMAKIEQIKKQFQQKR
ncbi:MAG: M28 family peptidase [Candidatus Hodarchaeales archaeon]|jgi:ABC-type antimicrobial peptide transport system permease subunit